MDFVDYDRTADIIEEVRLVAMETGIPVFTAEQSDDSEAVPNQQGKIK
jgi:hypothetical protein